MKKITIAFLAGCLALVAGCWLPGVRGNGHIKIDDRKIDAFANIDASGAFVINWQNGPPTLRIKTDANLFPYIESEISGNTLRLRTREQIRPTHGITVSVASPAREAAKIRGAVKLAATQLTGPKFALEGTGASRISLDGSIDQLLVDMTGASDLKAAGLQTKTAEISIQGAGDAEVAVTEKLKVAIAGAGKVTYSGNPPMIEKHISGAGSIRHKD
jgi:putative autotransporter adhesin-like protein